MTFSSTKFRVQGFDGRIRAFNINSYGAIVDSITPYEFVFLQDYSSSFTGNMPPRTGPWVNSPQILDYVANGLAIAFPSSRLGLAHFSDYPTLPYGVPGEDFVYQEILPLSPAGDVAPLDWNTYGYTNAQHGGLPYVDGGDSYNCGYDAVIAAAQSTTIGWSSPDFYNGNYYKYIIVLTDKFPHDGLIETGAPHATAYDAVIACADRNARLIYLIINEEYIKTFQRLIIYNQTADMFKTSYVYTTTPEYIYNPYKLSSYVINTIYQNQT